MDEKEACPCCNSDRIITYWTENNLYVIECDVCGIMVAKQHISASEKAWNTRIPELPDPCTVEQYEEITGETLPDDRAVWVREPITDPDITHMWYLLQYKTTKIGKAYPTFIVQTGKAAPKSEWRPG